MKAELLILNGQVLEEKDWPDDYTPMNRRRGGSLTSSQNIIFCSMASALAHRAPAPSIQQTTNEVIR
jgi:hypothetical protein